MADQADVAIGLADLVADRMIQGQFADWRVAGCASACRRSGFSLHRPCRRSTLR